MKSIYSNFLTLIMLVSTAVAMQDTVSTQLLRSAYEDNKYSQVIDMVKSDLNRHPQQDTDRLERLLKYLALAQASMGKDYDAQSTYTTLLLVNPEFSFNTGEISPKIQSLFDKTQMNSNAETSSLAPAPSYLILRDRRSEFILKSVAFPGWGQLEAKQRRAYVWGTLFTAGAAGVVLTAIMTSRTHDDYLLAVEPDDIKNQYDAYNTWYRARNNFLVFTASIYALNIIDISASTPRVQSP